MSSADLIQLLKSRMFQAGFKLFLAAGSCLIATILLMVTDPRVRTVAPIFGFTSVCLSMQERVEATTERVSHALARIASCSRPVVVQVSFVAYQYDQS